MSIELYILNTEPLKQDEYFEIGLSKSTQYRRNKVLALKHREMQALSLGAGLLLQKALKYEGFSIFKLKILNNSNGKPYFTDNNISFSLSHSGSYALCALSIKDMNVGADIEQINYAKLNIAKRFFSQNDVNYIMSQKDTDNQKTAFTKIWTQKEAYAKMLGISVTDVLKMDDYGPACFNSLSYNNYMITLCTEAYYKLNDFTILDMQNVLE